MKKIIFLVLAALLLVCASAGCIAEEEEERQQYYMNGENLVFVYVDKETGVEYLIYAGYKQGGMSPRYNADGTLKINEEFRK